MYWQFVTVMGADLLTMNVREWIEITFHSCHNTDYENPPSGTIESCIVLEHRCIMLFTTIFFCNKNFYHCVSKHCFVKLGHKWCHQLYIVVSSPDACYKSASLCSFMLTFK